MIFEYNACMYRLSKQHILGIHIEIVYKIYYRKCIYINEHILID